MALRSIASSDIAYDYDRNLALHSFAASGRPEQAYSRSSSPISAETTGKALSTILHGEGIKEVLYPAHTAGVAGGFLSLFDFGGSQPTKAP